jgi:hypothetical protein
MEFVMMKRSEEIVESTKDVGSRGPWGDKWQKIWEEKILVAEKGREGVWAATLLTA